VVGHGEKMSRKREQFITALLQLGTVTEAAEEVGIGQATAWRWMRDESFKSAYDEAKKEVLAGTIRKLQGIGLRAVETFYDIMQNPEAPASARVSAAKGVLELFMKAVETQELAERVGVIEKIVLPSPNRRSQ